MLASLSSDYKENLRAFLVKRTLFRIREACEGETQKVGEEVIDKENSSFERVND